MASKRFGILLFLLVFIFNAGLLFADTRWEGSVKSEGKSKQKKEIINNEKKERKEVKERLKEASLEKNRLKVITETLSESPIPLRTPDIFIRVMILPYTDESNILHTTKYTFMKVEEGKWIIGDYLTKPQQLKKETVFTPLQKAEPSEQKPQEIKPEQKQEKPEDKKEQNK